MTKNLRELLLEELIDDLEDIEIPDNPELIFEEEIGETLEYDLEPTQERKEQLLNETLEILETRPDANSGAHILNELLEETEDKLEVAIQEASAESLTEVTRELFNLPEQSVDTYLLIRGSYDMLFRDFIKSESISDGPLVVAIELQGEHVGYRKITPDPKTLYLLEKTLSNFELKLVENGIEKDLNIYEFLGKLRF